MLFRQPLLKKNQGSQEFSQQTEAPEIASTEINLQSEASQQMMGSQKQLEHIRYFNW